MFWRRTKTDPLEVARRRLRYAAIEYFKAGGDRRDARLVVDVALLDWRYLQ